MAAKKTAKTAEKETKVTAAKKVVKKADAPAPAAEVKKTAVKKETVRKEPTKKAAGKKEAPAKKAAEKKPAVIKKTVQEYKDVINWKKWEAHNMNWLYIEINAGDIMTELEAGVNNIKTVVDAILDCMLEGDTFIIESDKPSTKLTVRYYCDNLSEERRKYSEVNG